MAESRTHCCIAGGGPAGMMLGLLLARAGLRVTVLEKHADYLRDLRGDTIHPSTLELMHELGVLERFLELPHQKARQLAAQVGDQLITVGDFTHLPTQCKFIALMPQWDFLDFLADEARGYPGFELHMLTKATDLIRDDSDRIVGVRAETDEGNTEFLADLVVGADGRTSVLRDKAGLEVEQLGAPIDVLWFKVSRHATDPQTPMGRFDTGRIFVLLNRSDYWQCGYVIPKGSAERVKEAGLDAFRKDFAQLVPWAAERADEIASWDQVRLLTVRVDRLKRWYRSGFLCIGDAAHAMSPVGGVGINLAIQDAVAASNRLAKPLSENRLTDADLARVQKRRMLPTRITQHMQVMIQDRVIARVLETESALQTPWPLRMLAKHPRLRRIPARLIGIGIRPEHIAH
ncbi:MAG: FAD-dependent oxidoreductase [Gammaproteobacteria bacterium]